MGFLSCRTIFSDPKVQAQILTPWNTDFFTCYWWLELWNSATGSMHFFSSLFCLCSVIWSFGGNLCKYSSWCSSPQQQKGMVWLPMPSLQSGLLLKLLHQLHCTHVVSNAAEIDFKEHWNIQMLFSKWKSSTALANFTKLKHFILVLTWSPFCFSEQRWSMSCTGCLCIERSLLKIQCP